MLALDGRCWCLRCRWCKALVLGARRWCEVLVVRCRRYEVEGAGTAWEVLMWGAVVRGAGAKCGRAWPASEHTTTAGVRAHDHGQHQCTTRDGLRKRQLCWRAACLVQAHSSATGIPAVPPAWSRHTAVPPAYPPYQPQQCYRHTSSAACLVQAHSSATGIPAVPPAWSRHTAVLPAYLPYQPQQCYRHTSSAACLVQAHSSATGIPVIPATAVLPPYQQCRLPGPGTQQCYH